MVKFQAWSQEEREYDGKHRMGETVLEITVDDVLWTMYTLNVKLTDGNLERVLGKLEHSLWGNVRADLENLIQKTYGLEWEE